MGAVAYYLGILAVTRGDHEGALPQFEAAVALLGARSSRSGDRTAGAPRPVVQGMRGSKILWLQ